jgi:hypothetical protein
LPFLPAIIKSFKQPRRRQLSKRKKTFVVHQKHYDRALEVIEDLSNEGSKTEAFFIIASALGMMLVKATEREDDLKENVAFGQRVIDDVAGVMFRYREEMDQTIQ